MASELNDVIIKAQKIKEVLQLREYRSELKTKQSLTQGLQFVTYEYLDAEVADIIKTKYNLSSDAYAKMFNTVFHVMETQFPKLNHIELAEIACVHILYWSRINELSKLIVPFKHAALEPSYLPVEEKLFEFMEKNKL